MPGTVPSQTPDTFPHQKCLSLLSPDFNEFLVSLNDSYGAVTINRSKSTSVVVRAYTIRLPNCVNLYIYQTPAHNSPPLRLEAYAPEKLARLLDLHDECSSSLPVPSSFLPTVLYLSSQKSSTHQSFLLTTAPPGPFPPEPPLPQELLEHERIARLTSKDFESLRSLNIPIPSQSFCPWKIAFTRLLESILQDAEDISLMIPYEDIRGSVRRWMWALSDVKKGKLISFYEWFDWGDMDLEELGYDWNSLCKEEGAWYWLEKRGFRSNRTIRLLL